MAKTNNLTDYLNVHNGGIFRKLREDEIDYYSSILNTNDYECYVPHSIREETNDIVSIYDSIGITSQRFFSRIPESKLFPGNGKKEGK